MYIYVEANKKLRVVLFAFSNDRGIVIVLVGECKVYPIKKKNSALSNGELYTKLATVEMFAGVKIFNFFLILTFLGCSL